MEVIYAGEPCVTVNEYGKGKAYYLGTQPDEAFLKIFVHKVCEETECASGTSGGRRVLR